MAHKRKEFTEAQKASIFERDHATCAFSGISLWLLDNGIKNNWQMDWVDHIKPSAKGGGSELENGICASDFFNSKKRSNTSDNSYLFYAGKVTKDYVKTFGKPDAKILEQLHRLQYIEPEDWYFNRCIANTFIAFDWRCTKDFDNKVYKRNDVYWFKAGWKRLQKYNRKRPSATIKERNLLPSCLPFGFSDLLKLEMIDNEVDYLNWAEEIYPAYRATFKVFYDFFQENKNDKLVLLKTAYSDELVNPDMVETLMLYHENNNI